MKQLLMAAILCAILGSCKKNSSQDYDPSVKASLSVEFDNVAGSSDLQLNTGLYTNAAGENLRVTQLKYFVSNFVLTNINGDNYTVPQDSCYFLINESDENTHEPLLQVPEGEYKTLTFILGVDSMRNTMDISRRTGALDPAAAANGMYWGLNNGYIFFNMEGSSPAASAAAGVFRYHIGGFGGTGGVQNIRTIQLDLTARGIPKVKKGKETNIHLLMDVLAAFQGAANIHLATLTTIDDPASGQSVANNFSGMFRHDHTEN